MPGMKNVAPWNQDALWPSIISYTRVMKKLFLSAAMIAAALLPARAGTFSGIFDGFANNAAQNTIRPFALDLGGLLGADDQWDGRSLGFPGFDVGAIESFQDTPNSNDTILRAAFGNHPFMGIPMVQAAVGLPFRFDVVAHGMSYDGMTVLGGGLRYGILRSGTIMKFVPNLGVSVFGDQASYGAFDATHYAFNADASFDLPIIEPFIGAGLDRTSVTVNSVPGVNGDYGPVEGTRYTAGLELTPFPFTRIDVAYLSLHGIPGATAKMGFKF